MRSVFLRRLLVSLIIATLLAAAFMVLGHVLLSRDVYKEIQMEELLPKAEAVKQLFLEVYHNEMSLEAFSRMSDKLMRAAAALTIIIDAQGNIVFTDNSMLQLSSEELRSELDPYVQMLAGGQTVTEENVRIPGKGEFLLAAIPIFSDTGNTLGGVLIIKSASEIMLATGKLSASLLWIAGIVIPVMILIMSLRMRKVTDPLHEMSEAAIEMSKGHFDIRVSEKERGEVGLLASALNNLCETLSKTIYQLQAEKGQLDQILQSLTDGVVALDTVGNLTHYNSALMRMFGAIKVYKREDLVSDPMIWRAFDEVYHCGIPQTITRPMPGDKTVWITISPVVTDDDERVGVVGLFKDMTEMERLEATRREYVANVSHELRTPLTSIRALLEPLADGMVKSEEDKERYYKIMLHEVMRLSHLITDMMKLSRLQSGSDYIEMSRVNIVDLLKDVVSSYTATANQRGIELILDAEDAPDAMTDPNMVEQLLVILLDNAMRYTEEGGSITLSVRDGERLLVSVSDTGCGIPEADIPHIFERFYKVDKSRGEGGTGLGLSIAQLIIDKMQEKITVHSEVDKGTRFTFTLKKYVSQAIQLGPAREERMQRSKIARAQKRGAAAKNRVEDAEYQVIEAKGKDEL